VVAENAFTAYDLMQPLADFEVAIHDIDTIAIRDETGWVAENGALVSEVTHFDPYGVNIQIGRDIWGLNHELGHDWLNHTIGNPDTEHRWWVETGQGSDPPETWHAPRNAAYVQWRLDPSR
jgi:hypothetical protein